MEPSAGKDTFFLFIRALEKRRISERTLCYLQHNQSGFRFLRIFPNTWCGTETVRCNASGLNINIYEGHLLGMVTRRPSLKKKRKNTKGLKWESAIRVEEIPPSSMK